jgi:hypothetical protein
MLDIKANDDYGDRIYRVLSNPLRIWRTVDQIAREAGASLFESHSARHIDYYANASWIEKLRGHLGVGVD